MKISSKKVFIADIYKPANYNDTSFCIRDFIGECEFGFRGFEDELVEKDVILIQFGYRYVPIKYCQNMIAYLGLKVSSMHKFDERFIGFGHSSVFYQESKFLLNIRQFNTNKKLVSLKELLKRQTEYEETVYTQHDNNINNEFYNDVNTTSN